MDGAPWGKQGNMGLGHPATTGEPQNRRTQTVDLTLGETGLKATHMRARQFNFSSQSPQQSTLQAVILRNAISHWVIFNVPCGTGISDTNSSWKAVNS